METGQTSDSLAFPEYEGESQDYTYTEPVEEPSAPAKGTLKSARPRPDTQYSSMNASGSAETVQGVDANDGYAKMSVADATGLESDGYSSMAAVDVAGVGEIGSDGYAKMTTVGGPNANDGYVPLRSAEAGHGEKTDDGYMPLRSQGGLADDGYLNVTSLDTAHDGQADDNYMNVTSLDVAQTEHVQEAQGEALEEEEWNNQLTVEEERAAMAARDTETTEHVQEAQGEALEEEEWNNELTVEQERIKIAMDARLDEDLQRKRDVAPKTPQGKAAGQPETAAKKPSALARFGQKVKGAFSSLQSAKPEVDLPVIDDERGSSPAAATPPSHAEASSRKDTGVALPEIADRELTSSGKFSRAALLEQSKALTDSQKSAKNEKSKSKSKSISRS